MLAETTSVSEEQLEIESSSVAKLIVKLKDKYPELNNLDFKIAVDQRLVSNEDHIHAEAEVALLPPFAGG
ncbi:MoaD/ThiS family protein [Aquimarina sp. U1-2]|nr:MoaD/ThiS family protein [Aquimarina sp. U1-2]